MPEYMGKCQSLISESETILFYTDPLSCIFFSPALLPILDHLCQKIRIDLTCRTHLCKIHPCRFCYGYPLYRLHDDRGDHACPHWPPLRLRDRDVLPLIGGIAISWKSEGGHPLHGIYRLNNVMYTFSGIYHRIHVGPSL
jgi:hypothetical protein